MPPRYSRAADDDLREIYRTSVRLFGVAQAESYVAMLRNACALLGDFPASAAERRDIDPPVRARSAKSHVIIYEIDGEQRALILRIRHAREDWTTDPIDG